MRYITLILSLFLLLPLTADAAIAFGGSYHQTVSTSPRILAVTLAGANEELVWTCLVPATSNLVTASSYNGVAASFVNSVNSDAGANDYTLATYAFAATSTADSGNISCTTSSGSVGIEGTYYTGVLGGVDTSATNSGTNINSLTTSLTTTFVNEWVVLDGSDGGNTSTAGSITTARVQDTPGGAFVGDTNAAQAQGPVSVAFSWSGTSAGNKIGNTVAVALEPLAPAVVSLTPILSLTHSEVF